MFLTDLTQTRPDGFCWELRPQPGVVQLDWDSIHFSSQMPMQAHIGGGHISQWINFINIWKNMVLCWYLYWFYWFLCNFSTTSDLWSLKVDQIEWAFFSSIEHLWQAASPLSDTRGRRAETRQQLQPSNRKGCANSPWQSAINLIFSKEVKQRLWRHIFGPTRRKMWSHGLLRKIDGN